MTCPMCGDALKQPETGRKRRFCSNPCRLHHHRSKSAAGRNGIDYTPRAETIQQYKTARLSFHATGADGPAQQNDVVSLHGTRSDATKLQIDGRNERPKALDLFCGGGGERGSVAQWRAAMDIDWLKRETLVQAVPPAYSWYLARQVVER